MYTFFSRAFQKFKYYIRIAKGREVRYIPDVRLKKLLVGNYHAEWCIAPSYIKENAVIYSFGAGTDISFDIQLIEKYNCQVFSFDPTPRSVAWISKQNLPAQFKFTEIGVSNIDGVIRFYPPENPDHVSFSTEKTSFHDNSIELPVSKLSTLMARFGHKKIDLLKMDIEGAEYAVIDDLIDSGISVCQLLVEFHHRFDDINLKKTRKAIDSLRDNGFKIYYISPNGEEYSFIKLPQA